MLVDNIVTAKDLSVWLLPYDVTRFSVERLTNGRSNHTYLITEDGGARRVLRIYSKDNQTRTVVESEVAFMELLRRKDLPVPCLLRNHTGSVISEQTVQGRVWLYMLMDFEEGTHPSRYTPAVIEEMARAQAAIHLIGADYARQTKPHTRYSWLLRFFVRYGFSHCDFDASNLLMKGRKITCILDFEGMRYCPLIACLFFTLRRIYEAGGDSVAIRRYITVYQQKRSLSFIERAIINIALASRYRSPELLFSA